MVKKNNGYDQEINALFWLLILQGISFVLLGILVITYPAVLFILVATTFIWNGLSTMYIAWRLKKYRKMIHAVEE